MKAAPELVWRILSVVSIVAGVTIAILSDPIYSKLKNLHSYPIFSTIVVTVSAALTIGGLWWFIIIPCKVEEQSKPTGEVIPIPAKQPTAEEIANEVAKKITPPIPSSQIMMQLPSTGNLKERAIALSNAIMKELIMHGYHSHLPDGFRLPTWVEYRGQRYPVIQRMPKPTSEDYDKWLISESNFFRYNLCQKVLDLRNEFASLHIRDQELDNFLEKYPPLSYTEKHYVDQNKNEFIIKKPQAEQSRILPIEIEGVAERLKILASQLKD